MQARVIEVAGELIYLEVDNQIRFTSRYSLSCRPHQIVKNDCVDFAFTEGSGSNREVVINRVIHPASEPPRLV